jgi:two-component system, response regulator, stage 0 sporulation protein F
MSPESSPPSPHVLLAEDDPTFRALVARVLRERGFIVTEAGDGEELLELIAAPYARSEPMPTFDVILSDVQMPRFTALDVMLATRQARGGAKVVLMTAYGSEAVKNLAARRGVSCLVEKPFSLVELCSLLESLVGEDTAELD